MPYTHTLLLLREWHVVCYTEHREYSGCEYFAGTNFVAICYCFFWVFISWSRFHTLILVVQPLNIIYVYHFSCITTQTAKKMIVVGLQRNWEYLSVRVLRTQTLLCNMCAVLCMACMRLSDSEFPSPQEKNAIFSLLSDILFMCLPLRDIVIQLIFTLAYYHFVFESGLCVCVYIKRVMLEFWQFSWLSVWQQVYCGHNYCILSWFRAFSHSSHSKMKRKNQPSTHARMHTFTHRLTLITSFNFLRRKFVFLLLRVKFPDNKQF